MGFIREPKEVDFFVEDRPLTKEELRLLKAAIAKNKAAAIARRSGTVRTRARTKGRIKAKTKALR